MFEAPVFTIRGNITADAILYRPDPPLIVLAECKGGRSLQEEQARRCLVAESKGMFSGGSLPPVLRGPTPIPTAALFVGNEDHRPDLEAALSRIDLLAPLLTVSDKGARLIGCDDTHPLDGFEIAHDAGLPPARFPIDHHSPSEEIRELVAPILICAQARREELVDVEHVCRELLPEWSAVGNEARSVFRSRVDDVLRRLADSLLGEQLAYEPATKATPARVRITETPAASDPRGTPQSWQARQRRAAQALGRQRPRIEGQLEISLEDLAQTGGVGDQADEDRSQSGDNE